MLKNTTETSDVIMCEIFFLLDNEKYQRGKTLYRKNYKLFQMNKLGFLSFFLSYYYLQRNQLPLLIVFRFLIHIIYWERNLKSIIIEKKISKSKIIFK